MRIVHLDTGMELRGGQQQLLLLARGLRERGHELLIVCPESSALEARAVRERFGVFALPAHDPGHAHGILALRNQLSAESFQIFHAHDGRGQTVACLASLGMPVRRVASRRVAFLPRRLSGHRLKYTRTCDSVIAVSEFIRALLVTSGVPQSRIEVIADGIEIPPQLPSAEARLKLRAQWSIGPQDFAIGHVGAFTREKGQDIALEAAPRITERLPRARMLLAGDGPLRRSLEAQNRARRCGDGVAFLGYVEGLSAFIGALDLFIMPSRAEGLGSSALIAMAHGVPVVAARAGGLPEVVDEGKTGWLVPPESPAALADAIVAAAADPARLAQFGSNARERVRQFSADIMVERTESLYRRLSL